MTTICFAGTHDPGFNRTAIIADGLRRHGVVVEERVVSAWGSTEARLAAARRGLRNPGLLRRLASAYWRVLVGLRRLPSPPDALLLGHPGQLDTIVLRALAPRVPLVLDAFIALDETLADRAISSSGSPTRRLARVLDRIALRAADRVIVDTHAHGRRFAASYGLDPRRAIVVPVGAFDPGRESLRRSSESGNKMLRVLYFGGFIPLHGVPIMLEAARRLEPADGITLELVGDGQEAQQIEDALLGEPLPHVSLHRGWMPETELVERYVARADVCLGIFAISPKAMDVVPAKVYLALACGRAVLTADSPAIREEIVSRAPDTDAVMVCRAGDPAALVEALKTAREDRRRLSILGAAGRNLYEAHFRPEAVVEPLVSALQELHRGAARARD